MNFFQIEPERGLHANGRKLSSPVGPPNGIGADPQQLSQLSNGHAVIVGCSLHTSPP
jgi:hypothetical protein